jgi:hypothetical protein
MDEKIVSNEEREQAEQAPPEKHSIGGAVGAFVTMGLVDVLAHLGPTGLVIGGIASYVVWKHGYEVCEQVGAQVPLPAWPHKRAHTGGRSLLDRAFGRYPQISEVVESTLDDETQEEDDAVFTSPAAQTEVPGVARITVEQAIRHTERNSYEVFIGRSMSRPNHPAVKINFYKRHLKLIGASQHGKSSMAAALIDTITRTHDPEFVQIALLDLEDKTSRLFEGLPHIARVRMGGETVRLHARSSEQVLQHLDYISRVIDYRYSLPSDQLERQPIILVYLEEFVDLKDYFKQRALAAERDERDAAKQAYAQLVYFIKKIAARGLKVLVQLLMCAQVDYRDDDLQAALINVTSGMSFCVRPSAAQAAGFYQTEMLARNAREDKIGQAVAEMPDCKDLILAPEYDLKTLLSELARSSQRQQREPLPFPGADSLPATGTDVRSMPSLTPQSQMTRRHVTVQDAYNAWQEGATGIRKIERALNIPYNKAREFVMELQRQGLITLEEQRVID